MPPISKPKRLLLVLTSVVLMVCCALSMACASSTSGTSVVYPAPQGEEASKDYEVRADGRSVFVHVAPTLRGGPASFASFDFSGAVDATTDARSAHNANGTN